jgi:uncharacterized membrane protein YkoI
MTRSTVSILAGIVLATACANASAKEAPSAKLLKQATVSEATARATALEKVTNGSIRSSELEKEHGKLIWSFDISTPGTKNITEVNVDAKTGKIVATEVETPLKQKAEATAEAVEKK